MNSENILTDFEAFVKTSAMIPPLGGTNQPQNNQPQGTPPALTTTPVLSGAPAARQPNVPQVPQPQTMPKPLTPTNKPLKL
jgi:hypothetical protein